MKKKVTYLFALTWGVVALLTGCGKSGGNGSGDTLAERTQRALDSLITDNYFADPDVRPDLQAEFKAFYQNRQYHPAWVSEEKSLAQAEELLKSIDQAYREGLQPDDYNAREMRALQQKVFGANARKDNDRLANLVELDFRMTANYLTYASHLFSGRTNPTRLNQDWLSKPRKKDLSAYLGAAIENNRVSQSLTDLLPRNAQYAQLRQQLMRYAAIGAQGGWPIVSNPVSLGKGGSGPAVAALKMRLMRTGDLDSTQSGTGSGTQLVARSGDQPSAVVALVSSVASRDVFDAQVETALKNFQERHGQDPTGRIDSATLAELNVSAAQRIQQIELNMERLRWQSDSGLGNRYLLVNVPEFRVRVIEGNQVPLTMRVIVGREFTSTPIFTDTLEYLVFSPDWTVPNSIIEKEMLPRIRKNTDYLAKHDLWVFKTWGVGDTIPLDPEAVDWTNAKAADYRIVQKPGPRNPLGLVKFMFPNPMAIYLHDTPADHLFGAEQRGLSHGCVRVEKPLELAEYLLREKAGEWGRDSLLVHTRLEKPRIVKLARKTPIRITYQTAWVDERGRVNFRADLYGHDQVQTRAIVRKEKAL